MSPHLTDGDLRDFAAGVLAPDELLQADDHLSGCHACRGRAAALNGLSEAIDGLRAQLSGATSHLPDDELQLFVQGRLSAAAEEVVFRHLSECSTCSRHVNDLRSWAASTSRVRWRPLAIAAAILLAVLIPAAIWQARIGRQITSTSLSGLEALDPADQARVRGALNAGVAAVPDFLAEVSTSREVLMGPRAAAANTFEVTAPVATGTVGDRPQFEWQPLAGADGYVVSVFDERSNVVARSPSVAEAKWVPSEPLPRGRTYVWQVVARRGGEAITAPAAPAPAAKFHIVDAHSAEVVQRMEADYPQSHVLLGILNMNAGLRDQAAMQFRQVQPTDPHADIARRSLDRLKTLIDPRFRR